MDIKGLVMFSFSPFFFHTMFKQHYQNMVTHNDLDKMEVTKTRLSYISEHELDVEDPVNKYKCKCLAAFSLPLKKVALAQ